MMKVYLKSKLGEIILFAVIIGLFVLSIFLYQLPIETAIYPSALCVFAFAVYLICSYLYQSRRTKRLTRIINYEDITAGEIEEYKTLCEREYQRIIKDLARQNADIVSAEDEKYNEMIDYYTLWAHQIKTPIASMNLALQSEDTPTSRQIARDLLRIEQYVQMVLTYLRLDSSTTDYILREYELDEIIKQSVKKFSSEFIAKKISIDITPSEYRLVTDEKWLSFVIEQILSNSLKYSDGGIIKIFIQDKILNISDEGIGIAEEDLPRIFERGYTGYNGRNHKKASGIGLYLCKRICDNLNIKISVTSKLGKGTTIRLDLRQYKTDKYE